MKISAFLLFAVIACLGCGKSHNNSDPVPAPEKPLLLFPAENSACTPSTILSSSQSSVVLSWAAVKNADNYDVNLKNLTTGEVTVQNVALPQWLVQLSRGTPYAWSVIAKSTKTTAVTQSDTWKFYNPGPGTVYYLPFPADAVTPANGQSVTAVSSKIDLKWKGSDPDNDIAGYDVYLGTSATSTTLIKSGVTDMFLNGNTVTSGTTYYWKVVTKDIRGNVSDSGMFNFRVN